MTDEMTNPPTQVQPDSIQTARTAALTRLSQRAIASDLTLDEYAERASLINAARTEADLNAAVAGLAEDQVEAHPDHHARWMVGILGGAEERGRWRLSSRLRIVAVLGGAKLDLGNAQPEASESVITVFAFLGGATLLAPPGIPIELSGVSVLGGKSDKRPSGAPLPGAPVISVRVFALLGGVGVEARSTRRRLADVIRRNRAQPSNTEREDSSTN